MEYFIVEGPTKLKGDFYPKGNKNAALPIIAATLLTDKDVILKNLPEIEDVKIMLEILKSLGGTVEKIKKNEYKINCSNVNNFVIDDKLGQKIRTSLLFAGPLLSRFGKAKFPRPGGDVIGKRRLDTHFLGFQKLGATFKINKHFELNAKKLKGTFIYLDEASVTGTENIIMAATFAEGVTIIYNAACEPHVQDLCNFINKLGGKISGIGTNKLIIEGVASLNGGEWQIISDHIEVGSIIGLAAVTHSKLRIKNIIPQHYHIIKNSFNKIGVDFYFEENDIIVPENQDLTVHPDIDNSIPVISDSIWPGFPADLTSIAVTIATQAKGTIVIFEKLFESRLFFTDKLVNLGAKLVLCDPHRVVVSGPNSLYGGEVTSPDIRAGMAMLIATLVAKGQSKIFNIIQIDRGYEKIDERLNALGAKIKRIKE